MLEYDSENLNSDEIYSSLRGVTEAIQNFSFRSQEELVEPLRRDGKRDGLVRAAAAAAAAAATAASMASLPQFDSLNFHLSCSLDRAPPRTRTWWQAAALPWTTRRRC